MSPKYSLQMSTLLESADCSVAVVLVNWNGWQECIECINSVLAQAHPNFHLFIVDNDSHDLSIERIAAWCSAPAADPGWRYAPGVDRHTDRIPGAAVSYRVVENLDDNLPPLVDGCRVTLIRSGGNLGFAGGCNVGIRAAGLDEFTYFWFLNPDTVVERRALKELIDRAQAQADIGIVGSTLLFYDEPDTVYALAGGRINRLNGHGSHIGARLPASSIPTDGSAVERELSWVCGASMLVSASFIHETGLMQEDYFLYYEEADWATRGLDRSFRLGFAPTSVVFHKSGANSSKVMPMLTSGFYYRSRLRFVKRFLPDRMGAAKRQLFVEMLRHLVRGRWAAARLVGSTLLWTPPI
jgi:GT2 family glycosyltransferase